MMILSQGEARKLLILKEGALWEGLSKSIEEDNPDKNLALLFEVLRYPESLAKIFPCHKQPCCNTQIEKKLALLN